MKYIIAVLILFFISGCGLKPSLDDPKLSNVQLDLEKFLVGDLVAYGQFQDVLGNVSRRFIVNTRWKALAEIYTVHSFAPFWNP